MSLIRPIEYDADASIPEDLMRPIALLISVIDLPNFIMTSRWFAQQAEKWWQFHTTRIFGEHSQRDKLNWHSFFFDSYLKLHFNIWDVRYRRRALLIMDGNIEQLRYEAHEGIKYKMRAGGSIWVTNSLTVEEIFTDHNCEKSLLAVAHSVSPTNKKKALDFFYELIIEHECKHILSENRLKIIRNALELFPGLTSQQYYSLSTYVIKSLNTGSPVADALIADCYATTLLLLQCGADLNEPIEYGYSRYFNPVRIPTALEYLIIRVAELVNNPYHARAVEAGSSWKQKDGVRELIDYCKLHFNDLLKETVAKSAKPTKSAETDESIDSADYSDYSDYSDFDDSTDSIESTDPVSENKLSNKQLH